MTKRIDRKRHSMVFILVSISLFLGFCVGAISGGQAFSDKEDNWFKLIKVDEEIFDAFRGQIETNQEALEAFMNSDTEGIRKSTKNLEKQTEQMTELGTRRSELLRILDL